MRAAWRHKNSKSIEPVVVIIPAYNESTTIGQVIGDIRSLGYDTIVIDDLSTDETITVARTAGAIVLPLSLRLGAWGAIQTGLRYAWYRGYRTAITMDADGQHSAAHIPSLLTPLVNQRADVVIGAYVGRAGRIRRIAWAYFRLLTGLKLHDITSGFRVYNHRAIPLLASAEASLLDYQDVGVLLILRRQGLRITEVSVSMQPRLAGSSRVFSSWPIVAKYMLQTTLLCLARIGIDRLSPR